MSLLGHRVQRTEDAALLRSTGHYVGDLAPEGAVHAVFVRSIDPHGTIENIDVSEAANMAGVVAIYTATDLSIAANPPAMPALNQAMLRTALACDRVRYVGEPVAVVLAESYEAGVDAAEAVVVEIDPLPAMDVATALEEKHLLFPEAGTNVAYAVLSEDADDLFAGCEVTVSLAFTNPRVSGAPIEPRSAVASWSGDGESARLTQWSSTQFPHTARDALAAACGVQPDCVRVITPEVGGGFGAKSGSYPEDIVVALASRAVGRPVRWVETRTECMLNLAHGRGQEFTATLGGSRDGLIQAYQLHIVQDSGAYPMIGAILPMVGRMMGTGSYAIPKMQFTCSSVVTNTVPVGAYRGAGRPEATHAIERMMDLFATEIGLDPAEIRRRNFIRPEDFPHTTVAGQTYDSGRYEDALDAVLGAIDLPSFRIEQTRRRADTAKTLLGIGWAAYVEIANPLGAGEFGSVTIRPDGSALVFTGSSSHGQGHHTAFAQVAADVLGIPFERIEVRHGDTDQVKRGGGTGGSRSLQVGGSAIHAASERVVEMARDLAAQMLEANPVDIELNRKQGAFFVAGTPAVTIAWEQVAATANEREESLMSEIDFQPSGATFPFGVHASVVEIDRETGAVRLLRHIACDDAGVLVNPLIVDGQVHGGVAAGVAQALMEEFTYDDVGNPLTPNFMEYGIVSAAELPFFERLEQETPTDLNPLGVKGIGEAGTIGALPAVQNAVVDALAHLGVKHVDIPLTPERVWRAIVSHQG